MKRFIITASLTAAWYSPRSDLHTAPSGAKNLNSILSKLSFTIPGNPAIMSGMEYDIISFHNGLLKVNFIFRRSGIKSTAHTTQLRNTAKMMYEKSGTAGMKFNSILSGLEWR